MRVTLGKRGAYWLGYYQDGDGRVIRKGLGRRADAGGDVGPELAAIKLAAWAAGITDGRRAAKTPTVADWAKGYLALHPGLAEGSEYLLRSCGDRLAQFLGADTLLSAVTPLDAAKFVAWLTTDEGLAAGTVKRIVREAKSIFAKAADLEIIARDPFRAAKAPTARVDRKWAEVPLLTFERLLGASAGSWRGLLALCRLGGLRVNEARRLTWANVDLVGRRMTAENAGRYTDTKHHTRDVPICPHLHDVLFELSMTANGGERVLDGINLDDRDRQGKAICQRAGVQPWPRFWHTMRKAKEKEWAKEFPLHVAAEFAGNSPAVALRHYLKAEDSDFDRASAPLAKAAVLPDGGRP